MNSYFDDPQDEAVAAVLEVFRVVTSSYSILFYYLFKCYKMCILFFLKCNLFKISPKWVSLIEFIQEYFCVLAALQIKDFVSLYFFCAEN